MTAAWTPQDGPQLNAIQADWCDELFFGGAKFGGKSDFLLGDFLQGVEEHGENWHGILFRRSLPDLHKLIQRSHELFPKTGAEWGEQKKQWTWQNKATLRFRPLESVKDAAQYDGHEYPWIGFDELPQWPTDECYKRSISWNRWGAAKLPNKRIRATGNPGNVGQHWVFSYFLEHNPLGYEERINQDTERSVMFIPSRVRDNVIGLENNPNYINSLKGVGSPALVKAWLEGDWTAIVGAYFPEFSLQKHVIQPFEIPKHWVRFGAFDWGSAKPFCFGWYAVSDGVDTIYPKGAVIKYREWYGASAPDVGLRMIAEDVAQGIRDRMAEGESLNYAVADPAIFTADGGPSIAERMQKTGVSFRRADNKRLPGWDQLRARLVGHDDKPMFYVFSTCSATIRVLPALQHDIRNPEDVDTDSEDHPGDETRYAIMSRPYDRPLPVIESPRGIHEMTFNELIEYHERKGRQRRKRI